MESLSGQILAEILGAPPRLGVEIKGELLFLPGQLLLHWIEKGAHHYKLLSSNSVKAAFCQEPIDSGWLSNSIVRWGIGPSGDWVVKFISPGEHTLSFVDSEPLTVMLPGFVFLGYGKEYYLWTIAKSSFDTEAEVFTVPLPNVYPDGRICFGPTVPPTCTPTTIDEAWRTFISSNFNSHLASGKSKMHPLDVTVQLQHVAIHKLKSYPIKDLNPYRGKIEQVVQQVIYSSTTW